MELIPNDPWEQQAVNLLTEYSKESTKAVAANNTVVTLLSDV